MLSQVEGLSEECKQVMKRPCDPNCVVVNLDGSFGNDPNDPLRPYTGCNPAIAVSDGNYLFMDFRCFQMCNAADLNRCDPDCFDRCQTYCHVPNNTMGNSVPLFCD